MHILSNQFIYNHIVDENRVVLSNITWTINHLTSKV